MNILEILGAKPTNNLETVYGHLKYVPAKLHRDEQATAELNELVKDYFPYDLARIGQAITGYGDQARYTNSNQCLQLVIEVDYDKGWIKTRLWEFKDDKGASSAPFEAGDPLEDIEGQKDKILAAAKEALDRLADNVQRKLDYEKKKSEEEA